MVFRIIATLLIALACNAGIAAELTYPIVDTAQSKCYDNKKEIAQPKPGEPFYGQDAQFQGHQPSYTLSQDGLTVYDKVSGLTWQRSPNTTGNGNPTTKNKVTLAQALALPEKLNASKFAGFSDWRLPSIKELYSLILFNGVDSGPNSDSSRMTPFIDTKYFKFAYGDTSAGERTIDSQWATTTTYVGPVFAGEGKKMFGVNFADGRIKGYGTTMRGRGEKTFYAICVRGNTGYGKNDFKDNGDGTITDRATGLMWSKNDSGKGMSWENALAWVQKMNSGNYLGHNDWRLPNAKELQSIVDYTRCPDTSSSAAIDPVFNCTQITNEIGRIDYPFYWTGTTHASVIGGANAVYIVFGRAAGWPSGMPGRQGSGRGGPRMDGPPDTDRPGTSSSQRQFVDVHGAGAQRSDPKTGDPSVFPYGHGPQGDVIRIYNFARCVRDALE